MKRKQTVVVLALLLAGAICSGCLFFAPTTNEVQTKCIQENKNPGEIVRISKADYLCPGVEPLPTPIPNIQNSIIANINQMCYGNTEAWKAPSNAIWLANTIGGNPEEWYFIVDHWVLEVKERYQSSLFGGYTTNYLRNLDYPGFGHLIAQLKNGKSITISNQNAWQMPSYEITKLELFCK